MIWSNKTCQFGLCFILITILPIKETFVIFWMISEPFQLKQHNVHAIFNKKKDKNRMKTNYKMYVGVCCLCFS